MFDLLICGCGSFRPEAEEEELCYIGDGSPESTPTTRRSNNNSNSRSAADVKNPYATRGLDKYSALLADLDQRRQQIYAKLGSDDHSLVRFVFPEPDHCRPVIVKLREKPPKSAETGLIPTKNHDKNDDSSPRKHRNPANIPPAASAIPDRCSASLERLRWPSYYMPVVIIAILLMLTVFGRSVAIMCTSLAWYLVPTLHSRRLKRPAKKNKEVARTSFELSSPRNNHMNVVGKGGTIRASSPLNRGHRRF